MKWWHLGVFIAALLVVGALFRMAERKPAGPTTYSECILEHTQGAPRTALMDIRKACRAQFPDTAPPED